MLSSLTVPAHELTENERSILELIWSEGPLARTDLSNRMGLTEASISRLTKELLKQNWLIETVSRERLKGQPKRPLAVNQNAALACGVYFSHTHLEMGLTNLSGDLLYKVTKKLKEPNVSTLVETTKDCLSEIKQMAPVEEEKIIGIAYSLPGDFIGEGAKINAHAYFPELMHIDLRDEIRDRLGFEIYVENDAACAALGERIHGIGQRFKDFLFIHLGHGIGSGIIIDGKLYRGFRGNSGIIGVQFPNNLPRPSGQDLLEFLKSHNIDVSDFYELEELSPTQTAPLRSWINRAASQLVQCLNLSARVLDPQAIILGGRLPLTIVRELVLEIDELGYCEEGVMLPRPKIYPSSLGPDAGVIGTSCLTFFQRLFSG